MLTIAAPIMFFVQIVTFSILVVQVYFWEFIEHAIELAKDVNNFYEK